MNAQAPVRANFRGDINGLRAWAVVAVVLYHFGVPGFDGGFVGVDVFFVISGLLMTGIAVSGLEGGNFSIARFYMARARRIAPALLVLCAALLASGWWLIPPADYEKLGTQAAASVTFVSNIQFWLESGYFDVSSHDKWLLHTWSLAVEWQFYLVLPVVLSVLWKLRPGRTVIFWAVVSGLVASLALSIALTPDKPTGSFFMLPTRAWEMLAGGVVYLLAGRLALHVLLRRALELVGLASIAICIGALDATFAWPGWRALFPVVGAMLVLLAAQDRSVFTGNPVAQWLGTRSYSIYLWHWPAAVAMRYLGVFDQSAWTVVALVFTLLMGEASYRWVESLSRASLGKLGVRRESLVLAGGVATVLFAGVLVLANHGFAGRLQPYIESVSAEQFNTNPRRSDCHVSQGAVSPSCMVGGAKLGVVILGDSHADALVTALAQALAPPYGVMQWSYSACPTLPGASRANVNLKNPCAEFVDWALKKLDTLPTDVPVVIVNRHAQYALGQNEDPAQKNIPWVSFSRPYAQSERAFLNEYAQHVTDLSCRLARTRKVYLVRPVPEMGVNVPDQARAMVFGAAREVVISLDDYQARNGFVLAAQDAARVRCGVQILDPLPYLCWGRVCHGSKDGHPLYSDDNHLSESGNKLLVPMFKQGLDPKLTGV